MSGGANNGAWEAGVMWGLVHYGNPSDFHWDVVTGISAGSINTAYMVGWSPSKVVEMTEAYTKVIRETKTSDIYSQWPQGITQGLHEKGLVNDSEGVKYINRIIEPFGQIRRRFTIAAADVGTGEFVEFNQTSIAFEEVAQAAMSSSSIPGFFPP